MMHTPVVQMWKMSSLSNVNVAPIESLPNVRGCPLATPLWALEFQFNKETKLTRDQKNAWDKRLAKVRGAMG